ncbi:Prostaglandin reductase 2 [Mactra antiquata]
MAADNKRVILRSRPGADNAPTIDNFTCEQCEYPATIKDGEVVIKTLYLSLDPAMRCRLNDDSGVDYIKPIEIGKTVQGLGAVGEIIDSKNEQFMKGDIVQSVTNWPWMKYFTAKTDDPSFPLLKVDSAVRDNPQIVLSLLGLSGLTSYLGVKNKGHVTSGANQTFVVSGAAGSCGNLAGQIAKLLGAKKVVGICGSDLKCDVLKSELNFDSTINYKTDNIPDRLKELCPDGIHSYFDNVGGTLSEHVIRQMSPNSHIILCGQIAVYNKDVPYPPPISEEIQSIMKDRNITRDRFLVLNYQDQFNEGIKQLQEWYLSGQLKVPEYVHEGIESTVTAFVNMMTSVKQEKVGKQMVKV